MKRAEEELLKIRPSSLAPIAMGVLLAASGVARAEPAGRSVNNVEGKLSLSLLVDRDDDDGDGVPDFESDRPVASALGDVVWIEPKGGPRTLDAVDGVSVRLIVDGKVVRPGALRNRRIARLGVQGIRAGATQIRWGTLELSVEVLDLLALDGTGAQIDLVKSHVSLSRSLPLASDGVAPDLEALSFVVTGAPERLPSSLGFASFRPDLRQLDSLGDVPLSTRPCPPGVDAALSCRTTPPLRAAGDVVDRSHPESREHSLVSEVGGRWVVGVGDAMATLRVGGPRSSAVGPLARLRGKLRVRLVRMTRGGLPPVGGEDRLARAVIDNELATANALWGQCGVVFGSEAELDFQIVDPPPSYLVAVGCDLGTPASGGEIELMVDGRRVRSESVAGQTPTQVANRLARALRAAGFRAVVSPNAEISPGARRSVDVLVRRSNGQFAELSEGAVPSSTDATLGVCLGEVDLSDGLAHFSDFDAPAGTVEERTLLKAFDDGDPTTVEVVVIPAFGSVGRIGESFIFGQGASLRNVVLIDRAAIRAGARSFALSHELGHVLLDLPGHPDDYGVDRPSLLMDADATDPTVFGPRRLTLADCERAFRQSGPGAPVPMLSVWPLASKSERRRPAVKKR